MPPAVEESQIDATGTRASRILETSEPSSMSRHGTTSPRSPGYEAPRRGKAPPVDSFSGETTGLTFDDWFPSLQRASDWNQWSDEEALIQLAGHLRGRALQERTLLRSTEKESPDAVVCALWGCLDAGSRALAAQDFRHASQREKESVADYISRLEQLFRQAYGREGMSDETRNTLLHSQLQEGLRYELMKVPAVSGSHSYRELCLAARNEEKRVAELAKRRQYQRTKWEHPDRPAPVFHEYGRVNHDRYIPNRYPQEPVPVPTQDQPA